jgi:PPOX class probable F420-dependent enzyme
MPSWTRRVFVRRRWATLQLPDRKLDARWSGECGSSTVGEVCCARNLFGPLADNDRDLRVVCRISRLGVIDTSTELGARAEQRLRSERTIWLATVARENTPSVRPVWFVWDGEGFFVFSQPNAAKVRHIAANPRVCLHLDPDEWGENIVIVTGEARVAPDHPPVDQTPAYVEKYAWGFERLGMSPSEYARVYSTPITIAFTRLRTYYRPSWRRYRWSCGRGDSARGRGSRLGRVKLRRLRDP